MRILFSKQILLAAVLMWLVAILSGCNSVGTDAQPTAVTPPTVIAPTAVSTPHPTKPDVLVYMKTSGGIAGIKTELTINVDGIGLIVDKGTQVRVVKVDAAQLSTLKAQVVAANAANLQDKYDNGNVADDIYRTIRLGPITTSKSVMVAEAGGQGITPDLLKNLISTLNSISVIK